MSLLHGSDFSHLAHGNAPCATPRHSHRCLQLHPARTRISRHATSLLWKAMSSTPRHFSRRLLRHQIENWRVFHGCRVENLSFPCRTQHMRQTRSVTHDQLRHTSLVTISRQSFQLSESKQMCWSCLRNAPRLCKCVEMSDQLVSTFTNEDVQHGPCHTDSWHRILRRITTIVMVFTYLLSVDVRLLECRITTTPVRTDTIEERSARSACVHTAIVNISALMEG